MKVGQSLIALCMLVFLVLMACDKDKDVDCMMNVTEDTRYFEFVTESGETFVAWTERDTVLTMVDAQLALDQSERTMHINGVILAENSPCEVNQGWSWYFDPDEWALADVSIEVCDGNPQYVEDNLEDYLNIGRYCPWSSVVLREINKPF